MKNRVRNDNDIWMISYLVRCLYLYLFICAPDCRWLKKATFVISKQYLINSLPQNNNYNFDWIYVWDCTSMVWHWLLSILYSISSFRLAFYACIYSNFYNYIDYIFDVTAENGIEYSDFDALAVWYLGAVIQYRNGMKEVWWLIVIETDTKSVSVIIIYIGLMGVKIRYEEWSLWFLWLKWIWITTVTKTIDSALFQT